MRALGAEAEADTAVYLTGGATAVLIGWREATIDIDVALIPESDRLLRGIARLKNELRIDVELASPADFIPVPAGWQDRSVFIARHFDEIEPELYRFPAVDSRSFRRRAEEILGAMR
jgi:hypothetical protein